MTTLFLVSGLIAVLIFLFLYGKKSHSSGEEPISTYDCTICNEKDCECTLEAPPENGRKESD